MKRLKLSSGIPFCPIIVIAQVHILQGILLSKRLAFVDHMFCYAGCAFLRGRNVRL
jgi:hypothetical protein